MAGHIFSAPNWMVGDTTTLAQAPPGFESSASKHENKSEASCFENLACHHVRIHVASWPAILKVALLCSLGVCWDADRCSSVGHTVRELVNGGSLVGSSQTSVVTFTITFDVFHVLHSKLLYCVNDHCSSVGHTARELVNG